MVYDIYVSLAMATVMASGGGCYSSAESPDVRLSAFGSRDPGKK
jgi:hypothetical protein